MIFMCYTKCSTCQKAKKWLDANGIAYEERLIKEENPSAEELKAWHQMSGLPLKKFFQYQWYALQRNEIKGQASGNER